jgi:hypothetical protein
MRIVLATWPNFEFSKHMTEAGAAHRLLSFFELREHPRAWIEHYIMTGLVEKKPKSKQGWEHSVYIKKRRVALQRRVESFAGYVPE